VAERHGQGLDRDTVLAFFSKLLLGVEPNLSWYKKLAAMFGPASSTPAETARRAVALILSSPEAQLA
jgi:hypothetical protein